jgi:hypothetical protein
VALTKLAAFLEAVEKDLPRDKAMWLIHISGPMVKIPFWFYDDGFEYDEGWQETMV